MVGGGAVQVRLGPVGEERDATLYSISLKPSNLRLTMIFITSKPPTDEHQQETIASIPGDRIVKLYILVQLMNLMKNVMLVLVYQLDSNTYSY